MGTSERRPMALTDFEAEVLRDCVERLRDELRAEDLYQAELVLRIMEGVLGDA